jgi:D-alanyl-D-alanine carboxypeptidase
MAPLGKIMIFGGLGTAMMALLFSRNARAASGSGWTDYEPGFEPPVSESHPSNLRPQSYITTAERDARFGPLEWYASPSPTNPERIVITNDFPSQNLVKRAYPQLPGSPTIAIHRSAAEPLAEVLRDLKSRSMLHLIRSFDGSYNPRLVRGSQTSLSAHAYGTALDVNAGENPLGYGPTPDQEELAGVFEAHGWYWGDRFSRRDPMHFEWIGA